MNGASLVVFLLAGVFTYAMLRGGDGVDRRALGLYIVLLVALAVALEAAR